MRSAVCYYLVRGEIKNNTANVDGGGVYVCENSAVKSYGGKVRLNESTWGAGIYIKSSSYEMINITVENNKANNGGGLIITVNSILELRGGKIISNTADFNGGGVYGSGSALTMTGGEISQNTANTHGGGVYVYTNSSFEMTGGQISGNTAARDGGGVYLYSNTGNSFTMFGGEARRAKARRAEKLSAS